MSRVKHVYCVVYFNFYSYYRFRCSAISTASAKKMCVECMGVPKEHIIDCYRED